MNKDWKKGPLIDYVDLVSTGPFGSMLHKSDYSSVGVPIINPINIIGESIVPDIDKQVGVTTLSRLSSYVLKAGDVVVGRRGEIGRCAVIGMDEAGWICGTGCFFIRPGSGIDSNFLAWMLRSPSYRAQLERASSGATMKNLSNTALAQLPVLIPAIKEQRRIVAILDETFEGIATAKANAEKNLQNVRDLFEAYLAETFSQKDEIMSLSFCATDISDGDHAPPPKSSTGVPFITISNIDKESRRIDFSNTFTVPQEYFDALKPHRKPRKGDVLYTVTGSFGIPVLVEEGGFCFQRHIGLIRPKSDVDSQWLVYALLSPQVRSQAEFGATGTAQRTVSLGVLRGITVPKHDLEEQRAIAKRVCSVSDEITRLKDIQRAKLTALEDLKKSLLHQAFTGQL